MAAPLSLNGHGAYWRVSRQSDVPYLGGRGVYM